MNAKDVLSKIGKLLNLSSEEVLFVDAKTAEGTILQSPTFDLGEKVEVVSEDGTKSPAPDGEHEIALKDSEGNEVVIRIVTKDGEIVERENVEEAKPEVPEKGEEEMADADAEKIETTPLPGAPTAVNDKPESGSKKFPPKGGPSSMMSKVELENAEGPLGAHPETDEVASLPQTEDKEQEVEINLVDLGKMVQDMAYRITELESKIGDLTNKEEISKEAEVKKENDIKFNLDDASEDNLPKLDGAPVEMGAVFSAEEISKRYGKKVSNSQNTFLSKLYR